MGGGTTWRCLWTTGRMVYVAAAWCVLMAVGCGGTEPSDPVGGAEDLPLVFKDLSQRDVQVQPDTQVEDLGHGQDATVSDVWPPSDMVPDALKPDDISWDMAPDCGENCPSVCGDGSCSASENAATCAVDCPSLCGDGFCTHQESPTICPPDCTGCGDGICGPLENACSCAQDCQVQCGDGCCSPGESRCNCAVDCSVVCGDNCCSLGENPGNCPLDCPTTCGDGYCAGTETQCTCPSDCGQHCGNGVCDCNETPASCAKDCVKCGDGLCNGTETYCTCPADCPAQCGDGCCSQGESACNCPGDCTASCNDGCCTHSETPVTCLADCPTTCGDGHCAGTETKCTCPADCGPHCGNGVCDCGETMTTCPADCVVCGDGFCHAPETPTTCLADCPTTCGDGYCAGTETKCTCPVDCGPHCGNGICDCGETEASCYQDCYIPPLPSTACTTGSQNRDGCSKARIIGRSAARTTWSITNQNTCSASDRFTGNCNTLYSSGPDHTYVLFANKGETLNIVLKARTTKCTGLDSAMAPRLRIYYNSDTSSGGATSCPASIQCNGSGYDGGTVTVPYYVPDTGWYFLIVDGGASAWDEHKGYYDLTVALSYCDTADCGCP